MQLPHRIVELFQSEGSGLGSGGEAKGSGSTSLNFGVKDLPSVREELERRGVEFTGPTITISQPEGASSARG